MMPEPRVTAYWYSLTRGLPCDLESLLALGIAAAHLARWQGLGTLLVPEGPYWVNTWPEAIWDDVSGTYDDGCGDVVLPPWCPLPQGEQALRAIGY